MPWVALDPPPLCLISLPLLNWILPPTVRDIVVPRLSGERFISGGHPPGRTCVPRLFHAWSLLLAAACVALRFTAFTVLQGGGILGFRLCGPEGQGFSVDVSSLPLVLYVFSAVTYLSCSAAVRLLESLSELWRRSLFLLDDVGGAVYQYGCALALSLYSADAAWTRGVLGRAFLPAAALLAWLSCAARCYARRRPRRLGRRLGLSAAVGVACLLHISPVAHRLACHSWSSGWALHLLQVVLFLPSAILPSLPVCGRPPHQLSRLLLSLCVVAQQEALLQDFLWRRAALVRQLGEERLLLACASLPGLAMCCAATALSTRRPKETETQTPAEFCFYSLPTK
ncbi:membrane progestin receptor beta-like [Gasterosteus aculeatus]